MTGEGWTMMRFDEFAERINETVMPAESDLDRYIGLEHLDTMDLTIRRWDEGRNLVGKKLVVRKGDIIIARRNWYLRRVAIAPFDALCSAHAMIVRPVEGVINPEFFSNFLLSKQFYEKALAISVGSLSPTINWTTLRSCEFSLPSITLQHNFTPLLIASNQVRVANENLKDAYKECKKATIQEAYSKSILASKNTCHLQEICDEPISYGIVQAGPHQENGVPYIRVSDMIPEQFNLDEILRTSENISKKYQRSIVSENDVVICLRGDTGLTRLVPRELEGANLTQGTARISLNTDMNPSYVMWMFHSKQLRREIQRYMKGSTFKEISLTDLRKVKFPVVQKELQDKWSILIDDLHANWIRTQERSDNFRCLSSNLIDFYSSSEVKS